MRLPRFGTVAQAGERRHGGRMRDQPFADGRPAIPFSSLPHLLEHQAKRIPDAPAILAPGRVPLTYSHLYQHIKNTGHALRAMGIGRHDRIAVTLPNGPEMAVAILAAASSAVCVPMNPAYQGEELERYFVHLRPRALIAQAGIDSPARRVALSRGVRVIELSGAGDAEAGLFTLIGDREDVRSDELVGPRHVAVLLLTSGTTAQPKIVPQTHANICASAYSSVAAWALSETDRCINMLPLFHGHGLHNTLMASLAAGASVVCTGGWDSNSFFAWLTAFKPTWYSAVSTIHQAVLAQARNNHERLAECRLRFIRSGSAPLPSHILMELEATFDAPVIEYYAMTETTSTPIACNPLPPARRKAGSAGIPLSLDVAIMGEGGTFLSNGQRGEVVVRGAGIMPGYDGDPTATQSAFAGDWFKTGDLGFFDDDGYLFLAGRIREIINRGGEKITPQEVDQVLLEHPAVAEAVTFAVPHATLGEDVASAVVLRSNAAASPKEIRQFAIGRVADFKVPRQVLIVTKIPKGPTGKVQRIGLASELGLAASTTLSSVFVAPRTPLEKLLAERWAEILQLEQIGIEDDFFASGGDSLLAAHVLAHIYSVTKIELEASRFFDAPTVAEVAHHLEHAIQTGQAPRAPATLVCAARENGLMPASPAQEHLCKLQHALPDIPCFNTLYALRITSPCDVAVLERSINEVVRRHEILRTTIARIDGRYVQVVAPQLTVPLAFDDLHALPESRKQALGHQFLQDELLHSFDLAQGPLLRARLMRLAKQEYLLILSTHQIVSDGWSFGVLANELAALYDAFSSGAESPLAPLSIQFADFAFWQRRWKSHPDMIAQLDYWREQLRDPLPAIRLAKRRPPSRRIDAFRTARREWALPTGLSEAAKRFGQHEGGTLFMVLVAALKTLLHRYLAQDDLRVATLVANRNRPGTEGLVGPLANTVVLRTGLAGDPNPLEVLRRVRATTLAAYAHQDLPFEDLVENLERERARSPLPLSEVMITLHNATLRPIINCRTLIFEEANPGMPAPLVTITSADVIFMLHETAQGLRGHCVYKPHLFGTRTIDRLLRDFEGVLEQMMAQPERPISTIRISRNPSQPQGRAFDAERRRKS
jgi:acyl-CoA synthetase (AMP-forming)/AMP-acid ligase II